MCLASGCRNASEEGAADSGGAEPALAPDGHAAPIQTDARSYLARPLAGPAAPSPRYAFTVVAAFTNPTDRVVYLARATPDQPTPDAVVRLADGEPRSAYGPLVEGVGHDGQIAVGPGETRRDTFRLSGPNEWDGETGESVGLLSGTMRLVYAPQACRGDGACPLPDSVATSNPFRVVVDSAPQRSP